MVREEQWTEVNVKLKSKKNQTPYMITFSTPKQIVGVYSGYLDSAAFTQNVIHEKINGFDLHQ
jgi:hypothetical protein